MANLLHRYFRDQCGAGFTITRQLGPISSSCGTPRLPFLESRKAIRTNRALRTLVGAQSHAYDRAVRNRAQGAP